MEIFSVLFIWPAFCFDPSIDYVLYKRVGTYYTYEHALDGIAHHIDSTMKGVVPEGCNLNNAEFVIQGNISI